jgi:hypothetical protein
MGPVSRLTLGNPREPPPTTQPEPPVSVFCSVFCSVLVVPFVGGNKDRSLSEWHQQLNDEASVCQDSTWLFLGGGGALNSL